MLAIICEVGFLYASDFSRILMDDKEHSDEDFEVEEDPPKDHDYCVSTFQDPSPNSGTDPTTPENQILPSVGPDASANRQSLSGITTSQPSALAYSSFSQTQTINQPESSDVGSSITGRRGESSLGKRRYSEFASPPQSSGDRTATFAVELNRPETSSPEERKDESRDPISSKRRKETPKSGSSISGTETGSFSSSVASTTRDKSPIHLKTQETEALESVITPQTSDIQKRKIMTSSTDDSKTAREKDDVSDEGQDGASKEVLNFSLSKNPLECLTESKSDEILTGKARHLVANESASTINNPKVPLEGNLGEPELPENQVISGGSSPSTQRPNLLTDRPCIDADEVLQSAPSSELDLIRYDFRVSSYMLDARRLLLTVLEEIMTYSDVENWWKRIKYLSYRVSEPLWPGEETDHKERMCRSIRILFETDYLARELRSYLNQCENDFNSEFLVLPYEKFLYDGETINPYRKHYGKLIIVVISTLLSTLSVEESILWHQVPHYYREFKNVCTEISKFLRDPVMGVIEGYYYARKLNIPRKRMMLRLLLRMRNVFQIILMRFGEYAPPSLVDEMLQFLSEEDEKFLRRQIIPLGQPFHENRHGLLFPNRSI